jgi:hypothetical protein
VLQLLGKGGGTAMQLLRVRLPETPLWHLATMITHGAHDGMPQLPQILQSAPLG